MSSISQIIEAAGGSRAVAERAGVSRQAVGMWVKSGVPDWHWPTLMQMTRVTPEQLFEANQNCPDRASRNRETAA